MRILLDECVNPRLRGAFPNDEVATVSEAGWRTIENGALLAVAEGKFDVFVTIDRNIEYQHNIRGLGFGIVIVHVRKNRIAYYEPIFDELRRAVRSVRPGEVVHVVSPTLRS